MARKKPVRRPTDRQILDHLAKILTPPKTWPFSWYPRAFRRARVVLMDHGIVDEIVPPTDQRPDEEYE